MQEKKNKRLSILLAVLVSITVTVYWFGKSENNYEVDPALFKKYDLKTIDEISLESKGVKVNLKYQGSRWRVNDKFNASPDMIEVLFATLQQAEAKRPVAISIQDSVSSVLKNNGVKVSLLAAGETKETFYAGGNGSKSQAFFLEENAKVPYVVTIPGYRVYVSGVFELNESEWRDRFVFGFNWRNFQRLEVTFPGKSENFAVAMDDGYFGIEGITDVDTTKLNDFLDDVSLLSVDDYDSADTSLDSLAKTVPLMSLLVTDIGKREYLLQLYPESRESQQYDGLIDSVQWARFSKNKISKIVRGRNFFKKSQ